VTSWQPSQLQRERERYRRSRTLRSWLIALISTAVVATVVVLVVRSSTGWPRTRDSFFAFGTGWHDVPDLLRALWINIQIMLISEAFILVFAALIAILRTLRGPAFFPVRFLCALYVDLFRGLPFLLVLYLVGFGIPSLRLQGGPTDPKTLAIIALTLTYTAYVAEVFRAGIQSVVIFPQAVRRVLPPLLNDFISLQKDTSLASIVGVIEIVLTAQNFQSQDFKFVHYVMAGLIFLAMTIPLTRFTDWYARRQGWVLA
jgi:polar amino acid transport system permease protein